MFRKTTARLLGALLLPLALGACSSNDNPASPDDGGNGGTVTDGVISFLLDGTAKNYVDGAGAFSASAALLDIGAADNATSEAVSITMPKATGALVPNTGDNYGISIVVAGGIYTEKAGEFTINVTSVSGSRAVGTFSGPVENFLMETFQVTNGQFSVDFVDIP